MMIGRPLITSVGMEDGLSSLSPDEMTTNQSLDQRNQEFQVKSNLDGRSRVAHLSWISKEKGVVRAPSFHRLSATSILELDAMVKNVAVTLAEMTKGTGCLSAQDRVIENPTQGSRKSSHTVTN